MLNPQLVDEQIRGGVVQGLGAALFEQCRYDDRARCRTPTWPTTWCRWRARCPTSPSAMWCRRRREGALGAKGAGEAGTAGAAAACNAVNDALKPFGVTITEIPLTPRLSCGAGTGMMTSLKHDSEKWKPVFKAHAQTR